VVVLSHISTRRSSEKNLSQEEQEVLQKKNDSNERAKKIFTDNQFLNFFIKA